MRNFTRILALLAVAAISVSANAATLKNWTGTAGDWDYGNAANWSPSLPANNDYADIAVFGGAATPGTVTMATSLNGDTTPQHEGVNFTSAGWTLTVNFHDLGKVNSAGAGSNEMTNSFEVQQDGTWTIGTDNTLHLSGGLYERNKTITVKGGGMLWIGSAVQGYGSGTWGFSVTAGSVLRVDDGSPFSSAASNSAYVSIDDAAATLQLTGTIGSASALIGTRVLDGVGNGLTVTDLGNGYIEVSSTQIPEPASAALISLAGLMLIRRKR